MKLLLLSDKVVKSIFIIFISISLIIFSNLDTNILMDLNKKIASVRLTVLKCFLLLVFLLFNNICEELDFTDINSILDLGCGFGSASILLGNKGKIEVFGVTHSQRQLEFCEQRNDNPKVKFINQDYHQFLEETKQKFDLVWCVESTYHEVDRAGFFSQLRSVLSDKGKIVLVDYYASEILFEDPRFMDWKNGYHIGSISTERQFQNQIAFARLKERLTLDWTEYILPGSKRIGRLGALGKFPLKIMKALGMVSDDFYKGVLGSTAQYSLLKKGRWYYKIKILENI